MENMFVLLVNVLYGTCIYRRATIVKVANTGVQHCSLRFGHNVSVRDIITNSEAPLTTTRTNYDQELTITYDTSAYHAHIWTHFIVAFIVPCLLTTCYFARLLVKAELGNMFNSKYYMRNILPIPGRCVNLA